MSEKYIRFFRDRVTPFYNQPHIRELLEYSEEYERGIEPTLNVLMAVYLHECGNVFIDNKTIDNHKVGAKQPDFYLDNDWRLNVKTYCAPMFGDRGDPPRLRAKKHHLFGDIDNVEKNTHAYLLLFLEESLDLVTAELRVRGMVWDHPFSVAGWAGIMCWKEAK